MQIKIKIILVLLLFYSSAFANGIKDFKLVPQIGYHTVCIYGIPNHSPDIKNSWGGIKPTYFALKTQINRYDVKFSITRFYNESIPNTFSQIGNYDIIFYHMLNLSGGYNFRFKKISITPELLISKKERSLEDIYTYDNGTHKYTETIFSRRMGAGLGVDINYTLFKHFNLGTTINYTKYFEKQGYKNGEHEYPNYHNTYYDTYKPLNKFLNLNFYLGYIIDLKTK